MPEKATRKTLNGVGGEGWVRGPAWLSGWFPTEHRFSIQVPSNGNRNGFHIIQYIFVAESQNVPSGLFESLLPGLIIRVGVVVISTVNFHDQLFFHTCEIRDEWLNRELPTELEAA